MPWLVRMLFLALKTRRGRRLLVAGGAGAYNLARSERARELYAKALEGAAAAGRRVKR